MAAKIEDTERKALAAAEINEELTGDDLSRQFDALEFTGNSDNQLLELKKKMGLLPSGSDPLQITDGDEDVHDGELVEEESGEEKGDA